jgi:hypothetical protein
MFLSIFISFFGRFIFISVGDKQSRTPISSPPPPFSCISEMSCASNQKPKSPKEKKGGRK